MRDIMLVLHFLGLAMALGSGMVNLLLQMTTSKLEPAERGAFVSKLGVVGTFGRSGLGLLVLSGLALMTPHWKAMPYMPTLIAKLVLATLLVISALTLTVVANRAQKAGNMALLMKLRPFGMINFVLALVIVVLAVMTFH